MISMADVRRGFEESKEKGIDLWCRLEGNNIYDNRNGKYVCSLEVLTEYFRKKEHCNFEVIYYEHISLDEVYRCKECGTVIFGGDDYWRYDPKLKCPTCSDYETGLEFWTKEEIDNDPEKQRTIQMYENAQEEMNKAYERRKKRGGLYDFQLMDKSFYCKKHSYHIELRCDSILNKFKLKGLKLKIRIGYKTEEELSYIVRKTINIPLSISALITQIKCNHYIRKMNKEKNHEILNNEGSD